MKYQNFLNEDKISKALSLDEPEVGKDYPPEKVKRYIAIIDDAIKAMSSKEENDNNDAVISDLRDKKDKWKNVDKETKPTKTKLEVPPDKEEEPPPPEEDEQQQQQQESKIRNLFK